MTRLQARRLVTAKLEAAHIEDASREALALVAGVLGVEAHEVALDGGAVICADAESAILRAAALRASGCPRQYVLGTTPFWGRDFAVSKAVLIPRPDTEVLVECALKLLEGKRAPRVADVCTGSGCIAVSIALDRPDAAVSGFDVSPDALAVASHNAKRLDAEVTFEKRDLLAGVTDVFDLIVSNPPYIPTLDIEALDDTVRRHEPHLALDGGADGLVFYRRLVEEGRHRLTPGGALAFEVGFDQAKAVLVLMAQGGFTQLQTVRDLQGYERVVWGLRG